MKLGIHLSSFTYGVPASELGAAIGRIDTQQTALSYYASMGMSE